MALDKVVLALLKRCVTAFREARDRGANESDVPLAIYLYRELFPTQMAVLWRTSCQNSLKLSERVNRQ